MKSKMFFGLVVVCLATAGCSNDESLPGARGNGGEGGFGGTFVPVTICDEADAPEGCGVACSRDGDCALGTHCASSGVCDALCDSVRGCDMESVCDDRGRCDREIPMGGSGGMMGCIDDTVTPTRIEPNVMFVVDRSGSMNWLLDGTEDRDGDLAEWQRRRATGERTRWEIAHDAISSVLNDLDGIVQFGLASFSRVPITGTGTCPSVSVVGVAPNNAATILSSYLRTTDPRGGTPTAPSYQSVVSHLDANPGGGDGPTIIVLATDGEPNGCGGSGSTRSQVVTAVQSAFDNEGIQTFALSVGSDVGQDHLQDVANVGIGLAENGSEGNATFWVGTNAAALEQAFRSIVTAQLTCELNLNGVVENLNRVCEGDVRLDNMPLQCGVDWRLKPGTNDTIELLGSACDQWKQGEASITAQFPCGILQPG